MALYPADCRPIDRNQVEHKASRQTESKPDTSAVEQAQLSPRKQEILNRHMEKYDGLWRKLSKL